MPYRIACVVLAAVFSGCASYTGDESSPYYLVPAGSRLTLKQELKIPADQLAVFIQNGHVVRNNDVQHYYPYCKFELNSLGGATARTVQPDEIVVTKTSQQQLKGEAALAAPRPMMVAARGRALLASMNDNDGKSMQIYSTRMNLHSEKQPDIFRLSCAIWDESGIGRYVSIADIRRTLAGVFTLTLP